jgi:L-ascorbate metabolism protein UlaG (beta-lactamase superfamily)
MPEVARMKFPDSAIPDTSAGTVRFIGTATTLIRYGGFTLLTDPNFLHAGDHIHLGYGLVSERLTDPAIEIDDLPPVDLCILSHMHADHFDRVAAARLRKDLPIITTLQAARDLRGKGFRQTFALRTWEFFTAMKGESRLRITSMPGRHGPGILNAMMPSVMGSLLDFDAGAGRSRVRMYISGDTLIHEALREIPKRHPDIDVALLHLGGTRILGILVTMDAKQGVEALRIIRPRKAVPIHYDDYPVFKSPLEDFRRAVKEAGWEDKVAYLKRGETFTFAAPATEEMAGAHAGGGAARAPD